MARLFIAIDLPERIKDDITSTYSAIPGAKWIEEGQLHLTLRFIGDTDEPTKQRIVNALKSVSVQPFTISIKGVGFFPPRKEPRILWVGVSASEELLRLQGKIERTLVSIGISSEDRKFHPHITIARLSGSPHEKIAQFLTSNSLLSTENFSVTEYHLYESFLRKEGALHVREATYGLLG
jgi:RNA 2',3'-cyclic 3'-phosphodiesterase